jgi:hypothetical protein
MSNRLFVVVVATLLVAVISPAFGQEAFPEEMPATGIAPIERAIPKTLDMKEALSPSTDISLPVLSATESEGLFLDYAPLPMNRKVKIGVDRGMKVDGPSSAKSSLGKVTQLKDGSVVSTLRIQSVGAKGIRIHFMDCDLGTSGELVVYNLESPAEAVGPFTGRGPNGDGEFYSPTVFAEEVVLEYSAPGLPAVPPFQIVAINHLATNGEVKSDKVLNCHNDITCFSGYEYRNAIGRMYFIDDDDHGGYVCSGSLLVDMDPGTYKPYFLTANHCISSQAEANSLEVYWRYDTTTCNGTAPSLDSLSRSSGSAVLATRAMDLSDFSFLLLDQDPPTGTYFLGWNASDALIGSAVHGIHHPDGSYKRISFGSITSNFPPLDGINSANYWAVVWNSGVTEGGSSGSPLIYNSGQVVGQLTGGNSDFPCTDPNSIDIYGRFSKTYPFVSGYINVAPPTPTRTWTFTNTRTPTKTTTQAFTRTSTATPSPTRSETFTRTATSSATPSRTPTGTRTETPTRTGTPTKTGTPTNTGQPTATPTETQTSSVGDQIFLYSINWNVPPYGPNELIGLLRTL